MARKYCTKHPLRGRSHYHRRLEARGLSKAPALASVENLRSRQGKPEWLAAHPFIAANLAAYRGA